MENALNAPRLFGTNGIRGVAGETITSEFAYNIGSSISTINKGTSILVGRDGRVSSRMLVEGLIAGILAGGNRVEDVGQITTPGLQFLVKISGQNSGVIVTASHNPPEYNGFKIVDTDGIEIPRAKEERVEELVARKHWKTGRVAGKRIFPSKPIEPYLLSLQSHVSGKNVDGMKIVVDTGNGVAALTTPVLLRRIGCQVVTLNDNIDGRFPGRNSEPRPENLGPLATMVRQEGAAFGVAHDGDGDRAMFVDEKGVIHSGDMSLTLIEDEILRKNSGAKVVTPVNTSMSAREVAEKRHGKLILTPVGSINVARTMVKEKAVLGGEENGGIFYAPHQPVRDGAMATVLVLNAILENRVGLSKLMERLPKFFMHKEKRECRDERKASAIRRLREKLGNSVTSTIDGVRVDLDRGWFLVRASGTEPLIRIYVEGRSEKDMTRIRDEFNPLFDRSIGKS